ncbi:MAG: hypothetical protein WDZ32_02195, partial [Candidatus Saccharimonadales bacterium]
MIKNIDVIPMPGDKIIRGVDVVVSGDKILQIGKIGENISSGITKDVTEDSVIDGEGKFLIPGLFDMHVHLHDESFYPLFL